MPGRKTAKLSLKCLPYVWIMCGMPNICHTLPQNATKCNKSATKCTITSEIATLCYNLPHLGANHHEIHKLATTLPQLAKKCQIPAILWMLLYTTNLSCFAPQNATKCHKSSTLHHKLLQKAQIRYSSLQLATHWKKNTMRCHRLDRIRLQIAINLPQIAKNMPQNRHILPQNPMNWYESATKKNIEMSQPTMS